MNRHEGSIEVDNRLGRGTTFRIRLPVASALGEEFLEEPPTRTLAPMRLLVVEDQTSVRDVMVGYLSTDGHISETACNGLEGLERYRTGDFDLVITDLAMRGMNGDELAALIKQTDPDRPVLMLTGFSDLIGGSKDHTDVDLIVSKPVTLARISHKHRSSAPKGTNAFAADARYAALRLSWETDEYPGVEQLRDVPTHHVAPQSVGRRQPLSTVEDAHGHPGAHTRIADLNRSAILPIAFPS